MEYLDSKIMRHDDPELVKRASTTLRFHVGLAVRIPGTITRKC